MFSYRNRPILKTLGQFENLGIVIMSTRENIRIIARAPSLTKQKHQVLDLKAKPRRWYFKTEILDKHLMRGSVLQKCYSQSI